MQASIKGHENPIGSARLPPGSPAAYGNRNRPRPLTCQVKWPRKKIPDRLRKRRGPQRPSAHQIKRWMLRPTNMPMGCC